MSDYTESDYNNIHSHVGKLKRSAIDAYMRWNYPDFELREGEYVYEPADATPPFDKPIEHVTRLAANGTGGGKWSREGSGIDAVYEHVDFHTKFNDVRSQIDSIVNPWLELPKLSRIDGEIDECRRITEALSGTADVRNGVISGTGSIAPRLVGINSCLDKMGGNTIAQVKDKFLLKLPSAISGLQAISIVMGSALGSEYSLFSESRRAVAEAVIKTQKAFESSAKGGSTSLSVILNIAAQAVEGLIKYIGSKVNPSLILAGTTLNIVTKVESEDRTSKNRLKSYKKIVNNFKSNLKEIDNEITRGEEAVKDNIIYNLKTIRSNKQSYDLTVETIRSKEGVVILNYDLVNEITGVYMPGIADDLADTSRKTMNVSMSAAVFRDDGIGIGATGPNAQFSELGWLLYELLKDLSWDVRVGGANLKAAVELIQNEDAARRDAFNASIENIKRGSDVDPWD